MLIEKKMSAQLETRDMTIVYSINHLEMIKGDLHRKFSGRCYLGCFVVSILRIDQCSPLIMDYERTGGQVRYSVEFTVQAIVYVADEVIPRMQVTEIMPDGMIILTHENTVAAFEPHDKLKHIKIGDGMPVRIKESAYKPMVKTITCSAVPYVPIEFELEPWRVQITEDTLIHLRRLALPEIKIDPAIATLLAPYTAVPKLKPDEKICKFIDLSVGNWMVRCPLWLPPLHCIVTPDTKIAVTRADNLFRGYAERSRINTTLLADFARLYKFDKAEQHIWEIYTSNKLS